MTVAAEIGFSSFWKPVRSEFVAREFISLGIHFVFSAMSLVASALKMSLPPPATFILCLM